MAKKIAKVKKFKGVDQGRHKKVAKVKTAKNRKKKAKVKTSKVQRANFADTTSSVGAELNPKALLEAAPPMGEELDIRQEAVERIPDTRSVFDEGIGNFNPKTAQGGFGVAKKGETGTAAVARIKAEEAAAKKKKKKSKVKKRK